ncbi:MAG TPA: hypothetical protein VM285_00665 [Polyangia bacterium]|nr:hypothetical protein [Polyangia bacterium]
MTHHASCNMTVALLLASLLVACGGARGPSEANAIKPIMVTGCERNMNDSLPPDLRSLAGMVVALQSQRYEIHQVSPVEFKVFTAFRENRGITWAFEAQIYSDGSAQLQLPDTMPLQNAKVLRNIEAWGRKVAAVFDRHKCMPEQQLRAKSAAAGFPF